VVFRRRTPRGWLSLLSESFWPQAGWRRATSYVIHRMRRLPDTPHRISLGIACGQFVSCLPFFGFHLLSAALLAWLVRGNILAALLGTFFVNPITLPFIAVGGVELGAWLMGGDSTLGFRELMAAIGEGGADLWHNLRAPFTGETMRWDGLSVVFWRIFLPYCLGGVIIGLLTSAPLYYAFIPAISAYQRRRLAKLKDRFEAARARDRALLTDPPDPEDPP